MILDEDEKIQKDGNWVVQFELSLDKKVAYVLNGDKVERHKELDTVNVVESDKTLKVKQNELEGVKNKLSDIQRELTTESVEEKDKTDKVSMKEHIEAKMEKYEQKSRGNTTRMQ